MSLKIYFQQYETSSFVAIFFQALYLLIWFDWLCFICPSSSAPRSRRRKPRNGPRRITLTPIQSSTSRPSDKRGGEGGGGGDEWTPNPTFTSASLASEPPSPISEERKLLQLERSQRLRGRQGSRVARGRLEMMLSPGEHVGSWKDHSQSPSMDNLSESSAGSSDGAMRVFPTSTCLEGVAKRGEVDCSSSSHLNPHSKTGDSSVVESVQSMSPGTGLLSNTSLSPVPPRFGDVSVEQVDYKEELQQLAVVYGRAITGRNCFAGL